MPIRAEPIHRGREASFLGRRRICRLNRARNQFARTYATDSARDRNSRLLVPPSTSPLARFSIMEIKKEGSIPSSAVPTPLIRSHGFQNDARPPILANLTLDEYFFSEYFLYTNFHSNNTNFSLRQNWSRDFVYSYVLLPLR